MSAELLDILVVGAGPVGLTLASELNRYGIACRIIDKDPGTKTISKALILHVRTQEVFDAIGAIAAAKSVSVPMRQISLRAYGKIIGHLHAEIADSPYPHPIILGQDRTEHVLEEHLHQLGGRVEWQTEAIAFEQDATQVSVTVRHADGTEEVIRSHYLIACDGAHSMIRKQLGFRFEGGKYEGEQFIQADAKIRWTLPKGISHLFLTREGYMMVIEMPDDLVRVFISLPDHPADATVDEHGASDDAPSLQEVQDALNALGGVDAELYDPTWLARYRTSHRRADRFRDGRIFLAGDAGHIHVPLGGQGMNTGIQDAFNLAWKLAYTVQGKATPDLLDSYNAERVPVAEALLAGTDKSYRIILHPNELKQNAVRLLGPFIVNQQVVRTKLMHTLEEVDISYRDTSPIVEDHGGSGGAGAGDRAPNATIVRLADQETIQLFDAFRGTHWTLLLFTGQKATAETDQKLLSIQQKVSKVYSQLIHSYFVVPDLLPPQGLSGSDSILMDGEHFAHERYGVASACLYLIRPDWYIGFRGGIADRDRLMDYLARILMING